MPNNQHPESSTQYHFQNIHYPLPDTFFHERTGNRATNAEIARLIRKIAVALLLANPKQLNYDQTSEHR